MIHYYKLLNSAHGLLRIRVIVFDDHLHLPACDSARFIDFIDCQFGYRSSHSLQQ